MLESHRFESPSNTLKRDLFLFASIFGTQTQVGRPIHFLSFCIPLLIILFDQSKITILFLKIPLLITNDLVRWLTNKWSHTIIKFVMNWSHNFYFISQPFSEFYHIFSKIYFSCDLLNIFLKSFSKCFLLMGFRNMF